MGERRPQPFNHSIQNADGSLLGWRVAHPQHIAEQILVGVSIESQKAGHWQLTPAAVMTVEEGELLPAVGRIVRGIQVDRDVLDLALAQSLAVPLDYILGQRLAHAVELCSARSQTSTASIGR